MARLVALGFAAASLVLVLACTSSESSPIEIADAGPLPDAGVASDADPPPAPVGDGNTGSACAKASDCKGVNVECTLVRGPYAYLDGYCSAPCDPKTNTAGAKSATCPGTGAICQPAGKVCLAGCTNKQGARPCRTGYLCAFVTDDGVGACLPETYSQCDLTKRASCAAGKVCMSAGFDPVGECAPGCDLFAQDCTGGAGCYPTAIGEGHCTSVHVQGVDGDACSYTNDCVPGLSCSLEGAKSFCHPLCGGPAKKPCTNGKSCIDLSPSADVSIVGFCAG